MLVTKKKHDLLIKNYNELVDNRDRWLNHCRKAVDCLDESERRVRELRGVIKENNREINNLKFERDTYKEKYKQWFQNFIKTKAELERVDRIVLQYEQRINELEEQLNELHRKRH
ncbi:hypothetical protein vBEfaS95921_0037 [Enterococcus phage vB_EfaS_9592-1]|nr:hypothetical protein vBEfaS95921_0037 [Enterococcus phage vB_EfaS_9592-1]